MKTASAASLIITCLLALGATAARADLNTIRNSDSEVWGAAGAGVLDYKETVPGGELPDSEYGYIPSVAGGVSYLDSATDLYYAAEASVTFGDVRYQGALLATPTVPFDDSTQERICTTDAQLGMAFPLTDFAMVIPYAELGFRSWHRNLTSTEQEDYQHMDALGGVKLQVSPFDGTVVSLYAAGGSIFSPRMELDGVTFHLGNAMMYKGGGKIGYDIDDDLEVFTTLDYDHFRNVQSSVVDGGYYEPNSYTDEAEARIGIAYHF